MRGTGTCVDPGSTYVDPGSTYVELKSESTYVDPGSTRSRSTQCGSGTGPEWIWILAIRVITEYVMHGIVCIIYTDSNRSHHLRD